VGIPAGIGGAADADALADDDDDDALADTLTDDDDADALAEDDDALADDFTRTVFFFSFFSFFSFVATTGCCVLDSARGFFSIVVRQSNAVM
jgi:hypothetical protein